MKFGYAELFRKDMPPFQLLLRIFDTLVPKQHRAIKPRARTKKILHAPESSPPLVSLWVELRRQYFPSQPEIDSYRVYWSNRRQKRVLACCHIQRREVRVAKELKAEENQTWLPAILYHEMCHAALGLSLKRTRGKIPWHGKEFKDLVILHPGTEHLEKWIKTGGWSSAVRKDRARAAAASRVRHLKAVRSK